MNAAPTISVRERSRSASRPLCAAFCAVALGVSLFANSGAAKLVEVAYQRGEVAYAERPIAA